MERAVVTRENQKLPNDLDILHQRPLRKVFFCGSYAASGVPLLESAVRSAIKVVGYLGYDPLNQKIVDDVPYQDSNSETSLAA